MSNPKLRINSYTILGALQAKHSADVFISECKTGPTWGAGASGCPRLDAWALKRSWSNHCAIGYEIKVSRSDFLNDTKWQKYLDYCHEFYFVTPADLISVNECPHDAGLIYLSKTGSKLYTKKKAPYRSLALPVSLLLYIIICRSRFTVEHEPYSKKAFWENWMKEKQENWNFGCRVSKRIQEVIKNGVEKVNKENAELKNRNCQLQEIKDFIVKQGIDMDTWNYKWELEKRIDACGKDFLSNLNNIKRDIDVLIGKKHE